MTGDANRDNLQRATGNKQSRHCRNDWLYNKQKGGGLVAGNSSFGAF